MIRLNKIPPGFQVVSLTPEEAELDAGGFSIRGMRFGRMVALAAVLSEKKWHKRPRYVLFRCDCGRIVKRGIVGIRRRGVPDTCGKKCGLGPLLPKKKRKRPILQSVYGDDVKYTETPEYFAWARNRKELCKRWRDSFDLFLKDMGPKPPGLAINRRNPKLLHSPENSYWDYHGTDRSKIVWCGLRVLPRWFSDKFGIPYNYVRKLSWDNDEIDGKEIIRRYRKYQERLKIRKAQSQ